MDFNKKNLTLIIVTVLIAIGIYLYYVFYNPTKTLKQELANMFDRPVELIELNLPPADGRYPGTVLLTAQEGQSLTIKRENRPVNIPEKQSKVTINVDGNSDVNLFGKLIGSLNSSGDISIQIDLDDLRLFETDLDSKFKNDLLNDENIVRADKNGLKPRVIVRAYEAIVTYTVKKKSNIKVEQWNEIQEDLLKIGGSLANNGGITIKVEEPSIVAYETVFVNFISTNLKSGKPNDLIFKEYIVPEHTGSEIKLNQYNLEKGDSTVKYVTLGNSTYQSDYFGNLRLVDNSIKIVSEVFSLVGAKTLPNIENKNIVTENIMEKVIFDLESFIKKSENTSLLLFYYVGHSISGPNGHSYLVLNDYKGNPSKDIGVDFYHGLYRESINHSSSPFSGSNFSDIMDLMSVINGEYPKEILGLYPISKISKRFEKLGVPFVIIVDACYSHEQMEELRDRLNLTENGDYFGPDDFGGPNEVSKYSEAINRFGQSPYLNSSNIIILSSAPGSIAIQVPYPKPILSRNEYVAPLSRRIYNQLNSIVANGNPVSYGEFFYSMVDVKKIGEVRTQGVTSWSDFSKISTIEMLKPNVD